MNQFFYQLTRKASELVNSDDFRKRNIVKPTAFTRNRKLSKKEIEEIRSMIDAYKPEE